MSSFFTYSLYVIIVINVILGTAIVVLERKQPEKTIAWLLILLLIPPLGLILYIFLGRDWKIHKLNDDSFSKDINELVLPFVSSRQGIPEASLIELLANNSESPVFINNKISIFKDGNEKFEAFKKELKKAKHHIHLEYYIFKSDTLGKEIISLLLEKASEGVKIRIIIDKVGSAKMEKYYINKLKNAGIDIVIYSYFLVPLLKLINTQINYRNHRKIAIIDGKIGFLGGINIGDEYLGHNKKFGYWRDTHIMIKGDFVMGLQAVFLDDFLTIQQANNHYTFFDQHFDKYFPTTKVSDYTLMQLVKSGPDSSFPAIMQGILKMISMATTNIYITTPYFVPSESIMDSLTVAALGGVDVKIIFPEKADHFAVNMASKTYLGELIKCGVKVYLYDKNSFIHAKTMTIDGKLCTLGTANMDIRSFHLNYELNTVIYDDELTKDLDAIFFEDLNNCREFTLFEYQNSGKFNKFIEGLTRIFSSLL